MRALQRGDIPVLMYHSIATHRAAEPTCLALVDMAVSRDLFRRQMEYISRNYTTVGFEDLLQWRAGTIGLPDNPCIITFDDGYLDAYENAVPILEEFRLKACFFIIGSPLHGSSIPWLHAVYEILDNVPADRLVPVLRKHISEFPPTGELNKAELVAWLRRYSRRQCDNRKQRYAVLQALRDTLGVQVMKRPHLYMDAQEVRQISEKGFEIGCHSLAHQYLSRLTPRELEDDVAASKSLVQEATGRQPKAFCYPFGLEGTWNDVVVATLKKHGFTCACSSERGLNNRQTDLFALRRVHVSSDISFPAFVFRIHGLDAWRKVVSRFTRTRDQEEVWST